MRFDDCMINKFLFTFLLLVSFSVSADRQQPELSFNLTPVKKAIPASDFELLNMDDGKVKFYNYHGKVV